MLNIKCYSLNLGRIEGIFLALPKLIKYLKRIKPDIIHSQGIRADLLTSLVNNYCNLRIITLRNYALEDYLALYGFPGYIFGKLHWYVAKLNKHVVACSEKLAERLVAKGINCFGISNGIDVNKFRPNYTVYKEFKFQRPLFIVLGHLIKRKNNTCIVNLFDKYFANNKGTLLFVGEGDEKEYLKSLTNKKNIQFLGRVDNPEYYLQQADIIISNSKTEGLPNSILEGISCGLPAVLSNIPSHLEIKEKMPNEVFIFNIDNENDLLNKIKQALELLLKETKNNISEKIAEHFSSEKMSNKYQKLYLKYLNTK